MGDNRHRRTAVPMLRRLTLSYQFAAPPAHMPNAHENKYYIGTRPFTATSCKRSSLPGKCPPHRQCDSVRLLFKFRPHCTQPMADWLITAIIGTLKAQWLGMSWASTNVLVHCAAHALAIGTYAAATSLITIFEDNMCIRCIPHTYCTGCQPLQRRSVHWAELPHVEASTEMDQLHFQEVQAGEHRKHAHDVHKEWERIFTVCVHYRR